MKKQLFGSLSAVLLISMVLALYFGAAGFGLSELLGGLTNSPGFEFSHSVIWDVRLPRILAASICGASLAIAGAVLQSTFANPIVDSSLVGISSSAALGGALGLLFSANRNQILFSILGSVAVATVCVLVLTRTKFTGLRFTLFGFALGAIASALLALVTAGSRGANSRSLTTWLFGSLSLITWQAVTILFLVFLLGSVILRNQSRALDIVSMGLDSARHLGQDIGSKRKIWLLSCLVLIAPSVALCGVIGFVGLAAPHVARMLGAVRHKQLLPVAGLLGAIFVICADTLSRTITGAFEIPLSITLGLLGAPVLLLVLRGMPND